MGLWQWVLGIAAALAVMWVALVVALWVAARRQGEPTTLRDVMRLLPDVVRLLRRLAADPTLPRGVRLRLTALLVYLALPIDLIPDFIPVIGYADDAVIVVFALRSVTRVAGPEAIRRHWPGTEDGLRALGRLAGIPVG